MREIIFISLIFFLLIGCVYPSSSNKKVTITPDSITNDLETNIEERISEFYLPLDFESNKEWEISNKQFKTLAHWLNTFEKDTIFQKLEITDFEKYFILHIQAGMTRDIPVEIARKRLENLKEIIIGKLGFQEYDIPVFKVLTNLKYKEKHDIEITINRLMY